MMISAPTMVREQMMMFSGPWWASSVTSNRSLTTRLSSTPVRFLSKKLQDRSCMWVKRSRRMSASVSTPILCPSTVMT